MKWNNNLNLKWEKIKSDFGEIRLNENVNNSPQEFFLVSYLNTDRWIKANIEINSCQEFELFLDGEKIHTKDKINLSVRFFKCENEKITKELKLENGKHAIVLKSLLAKPLKVIGCSNRH